MRSVVHDQIETHGKGGAAPHRLGACGARVPVPARDRQGFGHPSVVWFRRGFSLTALFHIATQTTNLAERFGARSFSAFSQFAGFGAGSSLPFAINTYAADNSRKNLVKPLKRHFQNSDCYDPKRSNSGGQTLGYRGQDYERHHG